MTVTSSTLSALAGVRHAFFTRAGGVSSGIYASLNGGVGSQDDPAHVAENRARMAKTLGVAPENFITAYQIHSPDVIVAEKPWRADARPKGDAVVTRVPGLAIGGVIEATLGAMEKLGARSENIVTALGPMIRQPNYEVSAEFFRTFIEASQDNERFFQNSTRPDHYRFDLPGYIAARLALTGVAGIDDCGLCTYAEPDRFYSYRRSQHRNEPDYGRHVNAIVLSD